jgi:hypothetical protein
MHYPVNTGVSGRIQHIAVRHPNPGIVVHLVYLQRLPGILVGFPTVYFIFKNHTNN